MRKATLRLIRVPTQEVLRFIRAKSHATDNDAAWAKLHGLLSDPSIDEYERDMFEGYAKRFVSRRKLTERERDWLNRRSAPDFDAVAHRARLLDRDAYWHKHKRNGAMRLCVDCAAWDPAEPTDECSHDAVVAFHDAYAAKSATGLANRIVDARRTMELAKRTLRELVLDHCVHGKAEYESDDVVETDER